MSFRSPNKSMGNDVLLNDCTQICFSIRHSSFIISPMTPPNAELLRSLGKLARGLSALFWGLPASLIVCAETARIELLKPVGIVPALVVNALLLFGLWQMGDFQKQERPW